MTIAVKVIGVLAVLALAESTWRFQRGQYARAQLMLSAGGMFYAIAWLIHEGLLD